MYDQTVRDTVRRCYVYQRQPIGAAAQAAGVTEQTARRWKLAARQAGDCWDKARAAARIATGGLGDLTARVIEDFALLFEATIEELKHAQDIDAARKAEALSRLSDAYIKTMKAAGAVDPQIGRLSIALQVLDELAKFIREHHPDQLLAFTNILEPFGGRLSEVFG